MIASALHIHHVFNSGLIPRVKCVAFKIKRPFQSLRQGTGIGRLTFFGLNIGVEISDALESMVNAFAVVIIDASRDDVSFCSLYDRRLKDKRLQ